MRRSIDSLQAGRAFAAVAVVLYHANITLALPKYLGRDICPLLDFADCGVQYFFVLSGFVMWRVHGGDIGQPHRAWSFFRKRIERIYPPLWGVLLMLLPAYALVPMLGRGDELRLSTLVAAFLVLPASHESLLGTEWTLRHEMLFYLMFALLIRLPRAGVPAMALWLALSVVGGLLRPPFPLGFLFAGQHLLFGFGALACMAFGRGKVSRPGLWLGFGLLLFFGTWGLLSALRGTLHHNALWDWTYGLGAALAMAGGAALEARYPLRLPRVLLLLGEASYSIYLVHFPTVIALCKLVARLRPAILDPVLVLMLVATLAAGAGVVFHLWVERPLLGLFQQRRLVMRLQRS